MKGLKRLIFSLVIFFIVTSFSVKIYSGTAILSFDPPQTNTDGASLTDLAGYKAYWGASSGNYTNVLSVTRSLKPECQICANNITDICGDVICLTGLANSATYYMTLTAYDSSGNESGYASVCSGGADVLKTIPAATNPIGNIDTTGIGSATRVDGFDLIKLSAQFGLSIQESSGQCNATNVNKWANVNAQIIDLNGDGRIDGFDLISLSANFGKSQ